jgi:hypothetical protein
MSIFENHRFRRSTEFTLEMMLNGVFEKLQTSFSPHILISSPKEYLYIGFAGKTINHQKERPFEQLSRWPEELIEKLKISSRPDSTQYSSSSLTLKMSNQVYFNIEMGKKQTSILENESRQKLLRAINKIKVHQ